MPELLLWLLEGAALTGPRMAALPEAMGKAVPRLLPMLPLLPLPLLPLAPHLLLLPPPLPRSAPPRFRASLQYPPPWLLLLLLP